MAGTATTVTSLGTNWVSTVFQDAVTVFRANNVMSNVVTTFSDRVGDEARSLPGYNQLTAGTIAEATDISSESEFTKTNISTLSPVENYVFAFLTDRRQATDPQNARADVSVELGEAMRDKLETDLLGDFTNFTGGTVATGSGTALSWGSLLKARTILKANKIPGPYVAVIHENSWHHLAKAASVQTTRTNAPDSLMEAVKSSWYVDTYGDLSIFTTANITAGTASLQGVFNRSALALDWRRAPRLEPQRDASRRGYELVMTAHYGHGVWRPTAGCKITSDASASLIS